MKRLKNFQKFIIVNFKFFNFNIIYMPNIYRIVVTGGPCGGKTTVISNIKATF